MDDVDRFATGFSNADGVQLSNSVDVTLDLNGHYIERYNNAAGTNANKKAVFYVTGSAKLTVMDSVGGGEMLSSGEYANESNVKGEYISGRGTMYRIENVTVVSAPQTIDEQPTDLKFYLTSGTADKYVKLVVSTMSA